METVPRAAAIYLVLPALFRLAGRRTLREMTAFDFILLLIIGEATQQALLGDDLSVTTAAVAVTTLIALDIAMSLLEQRAGFLERMIDGVPTVLVADGTPLRERMRRARLDEQDVMERARALHGLERMDQIRFAVLEPGGDITIIPRRGAGRGEAGG
ncbi:DUF421 domain-containing protein [Caldovatus aquaticus]|uniref:DUF421 domain-containing protein n=1 Tax=Caldovatus aquaticus TaxID=2865671 RepID=A0ABS7F014_9PROT|nr:YetF domain-containing protein [Caldovatus aquaticus]MBW8268946.1 DUF421 domain-containing protein [Caldovatus aquaticus]